MSKIGKQPIEIPGNVEVSIDGQNVSIKGPKGEVARTLPREVEAKLDEKLLKVENLFSFHYI